MMPDELKKAELLIKRHEDFRSKPYKCSKGFWTIGWGFNIESHGLTLDDINHKWPNGINRQDADELFKADFLDVFNDLKDRLPWFKFLDAVRQTVLIDMAFNMGIAGLFGFKKTLELIRNNKFEEASIEMLNSKWKDDVKGRAIELSNMMRTGEW